MLIRSQNKRETITFELVNVFVIGEGGVFVLRACGLSDLSADSTVSLGEYQTEQRAIEVLDEICAFYKGCNHERTIKGAEVAAINGYVQNGVFQMPAE